MLVEKGTVKRRKMYHFMNMVKDFGFCDEHFGKLIENGKTYKGIYYILDSLDENRKKYVQENFENTQFTVLKAGYPGYMYTKVNALFIAY